MSGADVCNCSYCNSEEPMLDIFAVTVNLRDEGSTEDFHDHDITVYAYDAHDAIKNIEDVMKKLQLEYSSIIVTHPVK